MMRRSSVAADCYYTGGPQPCVRQPMPRSSHSSVHYCHYAGPPKTTTMRLLAHDAQLLHPCRQSSRWPLNTMTMHARTDYTKSMTYRFSVAADCHYPPPLASQSCALKPIMRRSGTTANCSRTGSWPSERQDNITHKSSIAAGCCLAGPQTPQ